GTLCSCGGPRATSTESVTPRASAAHVQVVQAEDRPSLTLVERAGDPSGGVAVAFADSGGAPVSVALAALLSSRLKTAGVPDVRSSVDALGFRLSVFAPNVEAGPSFVASVERALAAPVGSGDAALPSVRRELLRLS